jgi:hypothetical protein
MAARTRARRGQGAANFLVVLVLTGLIVLLGFFLLGGNLNLDLTPGNVDVRPPDANLDVQAPQVEVNPGNVDVEPPSIDIRPPGEGD